jgi:F420-dependent oxidoreductase-like protein
MTRPRLGYGVHVACAAMHWPECLDVARTAEDLGYHSIWWPDHWVATPDGVEPDPHAPLLDAWTTMGAIAQATSRIRFGPMVASNTFRHPAHFAKMAASLDHIGGGRVEVGLGIGWYDFEHTSFGIPFPPTAERLRALEEAVKIVRALWTEREVSFEGEFYRLEKAILEPKPLQRPGPPLVIASAGAKIGLRIVARYADHWNMYRPADLWADLARQLDAHCERQNRDPSEIVRSVMIPAYLEETEPVRTKIAQWGGREWFLVGSDDEIEDRVGRFVDAGADLVIVQVDAASGNADTLREFARRFFQRDGFSSGIR